MKKILLICVCSLLFLINSTAQNTGESKLGSWLEITTSNRISERISLSGSLTNWNYKLPTDRSQLVLGIIGINYHIKKNLVAGIGYANGSIDSTFEITDTPNIHENRILEQISINHNSKNISWNHRIRLEQRFLEYPIKNILKHRIRYRFKGILPISKTLFISAYDEIHFNLNEFDFQQNRVYAAIGLKFSNNLNLQIGYARHSFKTKSFHRVSLQLNSKFDFR